MCLPSLSLLGLTGQTEGRQISALRFSMEDPQWLALRSSIENADGHHGVLDRHPGDLHWYAA